MVQFCSMQGAGRNIAVFKDGTAVDFYAKCMRRVIDNLKIMFFSDCLYSYYITWITIYMGRKYGLRFICYCSLYF
ncbi:hypothetical protein D9M68_795680 [compost metagenome]